MVQVSAYRADETIKSCPTHDLLRELAITKAAEEIFLEIDGVGDAQFSAKARHVAVHCHSQRYTLKNSIPHVRSLLFFTINEFEYLDLDFTSFKLLRVLDLENIFILRLPKEIGEVSPLRYLCLRNTRIEQLPTSLGRLRNLQTLDICTFEFLEVPDVIWKLENLRNLYMQNTIRCKVPLKIDTLRNLQTLSMIEFRYLMPNNLLRLTRLQNLGIGIPTGSDMDKLFKSISKLEKLQSLTLLLNGHPSLAGLSKLSHVTKLKLKGTISLPTSPHHFPPNLSCLSLDGLCLSKNPMPMPEKLEQLSVLKLKAFRETQIAVKGNSFPRLKHFFLGYLYELPDIALGKGAMPELRCLRIENCHSLKMLPQELNCRTSLQRMEIVNMPKDFIMRIKEEHSHKVCRVPDVIVKDESHRII